MYVGRGKGIESINQKDVPVCVKIIPILNLRKRGKKKGKHLKMNWTIFGRVVDIVRKISGWRIGREKLVEICNFYYCFFL